jgi:hypothetical protein
MRSLKVVISGLACWAKPALAAATAEANANALTSGRAAKEICSMNKDLDETKGSKKLPGLRKAMADGFRQYLDPLSELVTWILLLALILLQPLKQMQR